MEFIYENFELRPFLIEIISDMKQIANPKNIKIESEISYNNLIVNLDKVKLKQAIINII
jgi:signal transduction histidine kinase